MFNWRTVTFELIGELRTGNIQWRIVGGFTKKRQILSVFLGSPSDLADEREAAHDVVERLNRVLARGLGWEIDLLGWEDTLPGFGRPQELINKDVEACDLFLGAIWARWGTPTGKYTSGFEEELELAMGRHHATNRPEIWIFFKQVPGSQLDDPGPDLQRVLALKRRLHESRELLTKDFEDIEAWKAQLSDSLLTYVMLLARSTPVEEGRSPQLVDRKLATSEASQVDTSPAERQANEAISRAKDALGQLIGSGRTIRDVVDERMSARLFLLAATWLFEGWTSDTLEAHPANVLYRNRKDISLLADEFRVVWKSMLANLESDNRPGWFWFRRFPPAAIERLLWIAADFGEDDVASGSLRCLALAKHVPRLDDGLTRRVLISALSSDRVAVREAGISYLSAMGAAETIATLLDEVVLPAEAVFRLQYSAALRASPTEAFKRLIAGDKHFASKRFALGMSQQIRRVEDEALKDGLLSSRSEVRVLTVRELSRRKKLSSTEAEKLLSDSSTNVRAAAIRSIGRLLSPAERSQRLKALIDETGNQQDLPVRERDELLRVLFDALAPSDIEAYVDWFSARGFVAYRSLAIRARYIPFSKRLIADLRDNFAGLQHRSIERLEQRVQDPGMASRILSEWEELDPFIRTHFTEAALDGVSARKLVSARDLVRDRLRSSDESVVSAAIRALREIGNRSDVLLLRKLVAHEDREISLEAARGALYLDPTLGSARTLLAMTDATLQLEAIRNLVKRKPTPRIDVKILLVNADTEVRKAAVGYLATTQDRETLTQLLDNYQSRDQYFYNVVAWLDRLIYAPRRLIQGWSKGDE